jgi:glutamine amidotransferase
MTITIIDYGMGNLASIQNMLKSLGIPSLISSDPKAISRAEKLILPGVGSFDQGVEKIQSKSFLVESIQETVVERIRPILGICLGMQLLMESSEEGDLPGLSLVPGTVKKFKKDSSIGKIHMGWNSIKILNAENPIFKYLESELRFYFVHGYFVIPENEIHTIAQTNFGIDFSSAINSNKIWGMQFHPEKSHKFGQAILKGFGEMEC